MISSTESPLCQGDLVVLASLPLWVIGDVSPVPSGPAAGYTIVPSWNRGLKLGPAQLLCAVCSHDCDIENVSSRTGLQVAPLMRIPASPANEKSRYDAILSSAERKDEEYDYIQLFPLELPEGVTPEGVTPDEWAVVDFSAITTIAKAKAAHEMLLSAKIATMTEAEASNFRTKLGASLGRPYQSPRDQTDSDEARGG